MQSNANNDENVIMKISMVLKHNDEMCHSGWSPPAAPSTQMKCVDWTPTQISCHTYSTVLTVNFAGDILLANEC